MYDKFQDKYNNLKVKYDTLYRKHKNQTREFDEFKEDTTKSILLIMPPLRNSITVIL